MDNLSLISLGTAFLAGLASFLSPCVLPLVPAYVGYLGGRSAFEKEGESRNRWSVFSHGLAFVIGFSVVFITLGIAASALGSLLIGARDWLEKIGGIVVIIFGLHMTGIWRIPFLLYDTRNQDQPANKKGYLSSFLMGVFFSAGWSPCVGPVLGAILTLSLSGGSVLTGGALLASYSAGLSIPFLIAALGVGWVTAALMKYGKAMHYLEITMGVVLIIVGGLLFFGLFEKITIYLTRFGTLFG
ncbi:MAG: cytochrome c biogenesis CcdA family protein [Anaerolineales bacterium]|nr:cytochrome c biogenesis CcdA family protein [Anaerolineales bacterium]